MKGHTDVVRLLLENRADANRPGKVLPRRLTVDECAYTTARA